MASLEHDFKIALEALEQNKLTDQEKEFVDYIKNYDKESLYSLTSKQFHFLNVISRKFDTSKEDDFKVYFDKIVELAKDIIRHPKKDIESKETASQILFLVSKELARRDKKTK